MDKEILQQRTLTFAVNVRALADKLVGMPTAHGTMTQLLDASQSVAANYRAACRARSRREFIAKLGVVVEECDESVFWLEFIRESRVLKSPELPDLLDEAQQLRAIFAVSCATARRNLRRSPNH